MVETSDISINSSVASLVALRGPSPDRGPSELTDILKNQGKDLLSGLLKGTRFARGLALVGDHRLMRTKVEAEVAAEFRVKEAEEAEADFEERLSASMPPERKEKFVQALVQLLKAVAMFVLHNRITVVAMMTTVLPALAVMIADVWSYEVMVQATTVGLTAIGLLLNVTRQIDLREKSERWRIVRIGSIVSLDRPRAGARNCSTLDFLPRGPGASPGRRSTEALAPPDGDDSPDLVDLVEVVADHECVGGR